MPNFSLNWKFGFFWTKFAQKWCFQSKIDKVHITFFTLHIWISLGTIFKIKLTILIFWTKFAQKGYFQSKTEKVNITTEFRMFGLGQVPNFSLNWQYWFLVPNLPKKCISDLKQKSCFFLCVHGRYFLY